MFEQLKHAFAVDPPGPATPNDDERRIVDRLASEVVRRRLTAPAILFLESSRSLNYVASQLLVFFAPFAQVIFHAGDYRTLVAFMERRGCVEYMCSRIEALEDEHCTAGARTAASGKKG